MTLIKSISGIRGTIGGKSGENLTPIDLVRFASGYGVWVLRQGSGNKVVIGRDGRVSGSVVSSIVVSTLRMLGIDVLDAGLTTTPTVEMAVVQEKAAGGIILTASHNPKEWNALKLLNQNGEFLGSEDGEMVLQLADEAIEYANVNTIGSYTQISPLKHHIDQILNLELVNTAAIQEANFKVVVDCINSTGALTIPPLLDILGVRYELINDDVTGEFAHNPEPLEKHLTDLIQAVRNSDAILGIAVDPDVDRLALISEDGTMFGEEYTLVAIADYVLQHKKGNTVSNLSSTRALKDITEAHGLTYHAAAVGEVNVVKQMKAVNAVIGGEGNGGVIVPELHYGRDALAGIALFLSLLSTRKKSPSELRSGYPSYFMSKQKIQLTPALNPDDLLQKMQEKYSNDECITIDGLKIMFENSWVHMRKSNTEPIIRIYTEAPTQESADSLANRFVDELGAIK